MRGLFYLFLLIVPALVGIREGMKLWPLPLGGILGGMLGLAAGALGIGLGQAVARVPLGSVAGGVGGLMVFWVLGKLFEDLYPPLTSGFFLMLLMVVGVMVGVRKGRELSVLFRRAEVPTVPKVLDTSAIIDGRIADICETGFLEGPILIPQFVLRELQYIADMTDPLRRARGRRGLDVLDRLQKHSKAPIRIIDEDYPEIKEVDQKLIELSRRKGAKIVTNDYNLNKVARLHGIEVLNVNELAQALRPVVLPGESLKVHVIREGKEPDQGVGYLEDGTMVVVEEGKKLIGQEVEITVTSVLQTSSGRIIFGKEKS